MGKDHCRIITFIYCPRKFKISGVINIVLLLAAQQSYQCSHCVVSRAPEQIWPQSVFCSQGQTLKNSRYCHSYSNHYGLSVVHFFFFWTLKQIPHYLFTYEHVKSWQKIKVLDTQQVQGTESSSDRLKHLVTEQILANISLKNWWEQLNNRRLNPVFIQWTKVLTNLLTGSWMTE